MSIADNVARVRARIADAAARAGRDPSEITLVAVTKTVSPERIVEALEAGIADLGENRAQELREKQDALPGVNARWHFIGALQRNKARLVAERVSLIHSVDSEALAAYIAEVVRPGSIDVLLEVNTSGERSKHGVPPGDASEGADSIARVPGIVLRGFMTVAAPGDEAAARASFRTLRQIRDTVAARFPEARELSMGMSDDLEGAVEEGATIVRVGSAIFGDRPSA